MSNLNVHKILEASKGSQDLSTTYTFKLRPEDKEEFLEFCSKHDLSPGKVLRNLLSDLIEGARNADI